MGSTQEKYIVIPEISPAPLERLSDKVFSDGRLVYKIYDRSLKHIKEDELKALKRVREISGCQKLVRSNELIIVTELAKGKRFEAGMKPTDKHIKGLLETLIKMGSVDVSFEPEPRNLVYSPNEGFTVIDLQTEKNPKISVPDLAVIFSEFDGTNSELFLQEYTRILSALYDVNKELAKKAIFEGNQLWITHSGHLNEISRNSSIFNNLQSVLQVKFGESLI